VIIEQSNSAYQWTDVERRTACEQYVDTVTENIEAFIKDKNHCRVSIEDAPAWLPEVWKRSGATGDLEAAMHELRVRHNAEATTGTQPILPG
jgi:hypothetical protein